ncbi:MAG: cytochrome c [Steroidobacteraceae bacterium]
MRAPRLSLIAALAATALTTVASAADAPDGKALFTRRCGICHLADGGGTWMLERRLGKAQSLLESRTDLQTPYILAIARHGLNGMPRFTRVELPDADLAAIAAYLTRSGPRP